MSQKSKQVLFLFVMIFPISGCTSLAAPNFFNGHYYLAGDKNCTIMLPVSASRISCAKKDGNFTGYRDAMNGEQLQMWQIQMTHRKMQMQQLSNSLDQLGQAADDWAEQSRQQAQQFTAPRVAPLQLGSETYGSTGMTNTYTAAHCQNVGNQISCRSKLPEANFSCTYVSGWYFCKPRS